jgi:hypothetical protein
MKELPLNIYGLLGLIGIIGGTLFGALQSWKWWLNNQKEIYELKARDAEAKAIEANAATKQDMLTAAQVGKLMQATDDVKRDIVEIRAANKDQNEMLIKAMDALEVNMKDFGEMFTKFLIARVNQFDQSLLKP